MPPVSNKSWIVISGVSLLTIGFLVFLLKDSNDAFDDQNDELDNQIMQNERLKQEKEAMKDSLLAELNDLSLQYDTLSKENLFLEDSISAQKLEIEALLNKVKNGSWEISKLKKEAASLREIMKGYIGTIDSLNQLNVALLDENLEMKQQMEAVSKENEALVERQENMEEMLVAGQTLQATELTATGIRILSSGRQRDTDRADKSSKIRVCFTLLENRIAPVGEKTLNLRIKNAGGNVLADENEATEVSATRVIDYARERLEACVFYSVPEGLTEEFLEPGTYLVEVLEGATVIGVTDLVLR